MGNEDGKIVVGSKIKCKVEHMCECWKDACHTNSFSADAIFTVKDLNNGNVFIEELNNIWCIAYFDLIDEPKVVNDITELEDLLKQIKISLKVTEDARKAYEVAKAKSLELSRKLQTKMKNI